MRKLITTLPLWFFYASNGKGIKATLYREEMRQLTLRKIMWENMILGIKVTSFYESRVKRDTIKGSTLSGLIEGKQDVEQMFEETMTGNF